jgi:hypothetical protein
VDFRKFADSRHDVPAKMVYISGSQKGCAAPWRRCDYLGSAKRQGALEAGPSVRLVLLISTELNLDQALGNRYYFTKFNHRIKNLETVKYLSNVVLFCTMTPERNNSGALVDVRC